MIKVLLSIVMFAILIAPAAAIAQQLVANKCINNTAGSSQFDCEVQCPVGKEAIDGGAGRDEAFDNDITTLLAYPVMQGIAVGDPNRIQGPATGWRSEKFFVDAGDFVFVWARCVSSTPALAVPLSGWLGWVLPVVAFGFVWSDRRRQR